MQTIFLHWFLIYLVYVQNYVSYIVSKLKAWNSEDGDNFWEKHGLFVHLRKTNNTILAWPYWFLLHWPWYSWLELGSFTRFCYKVEQKCGHSSFCTSVKYCNFHILCICIHLHQLFMILNIFANSKISQEEYSVWVFFTPICYVLLCQKPLRLNGSRFAASLA